METILKILKEVFIMTNDEKIKNVKVRKILRVILIILSISVIVTSILSKDGC